MPIITGFDKLASVPEEQITDKIGRRGRFITTKPAWGSGSSLPAESLHDADIGGCEMLRVA
jgi:hypothetical protein